MFDKVTLLLLTYARTLYATKTLRSTLDHVRYSGQLSVHIADDGSDEAHRTALYDLAGGYPNVVGVSVSNSERSGYGANFNLASQTVHLHTNLVLAVEDDWELTRELDLDALVKVLATEPRISCIRLGYLSFTQQLRGEVLDVDGYKYLLFDPDSPEPHVFAGHPRLECVTYQRAVGPWPEGLAPGATEFSVCHRRTARTGVAWPLDLVAPRGNMFAHIGAVRSTDSIPDNVKVLA